MSELSESTIFMIKRQMGDVNLKRIMAEIQGGPGDPATNEESRLVALLREQFGSFLTDEEMLSALRKNGGNVEVAQIELVGTVESKQSVNQLLGLFSDHIPRQLILDTLESQGGDVDMAARILSMAPLHKSRGSQPPAAPSKSTSPQPAEPVATPLSPGAARRELEAYKEQVKAQERTVSDAATLKRYANEYPLLPVGVIRGVLEECGYAIMQATPKLNALLVDHMVERLAKQFKAIPAETIREHVRDSGMHLATATASLEASLKASKEQAKEPVKKVDEAQAIMEKSIRITRQVAEDLSREEQARRTALTQRLAVVTTADEILKEPSPVQEEPKKEEPKRDDSAPAPPAVKCDPKSPRVMELTVKDARVDVGQSTYVTYSSLGDYEPTNYDWIAMYVVGNEGSNYVKYKYLTGSAKSGSLRFTPFAYGQYVFRFMSNKTYTVGGESAILEVGPVYTLSTIVQPSLRQVSVMYEQKTGQPQKSAWVGMYRAGETTTPSAYVAYQYLPASSPSGEVKLVIPKAGKWEVRLYPDRSYFVATTAEFEYSGVNEIQVRCDGPTTTVMVNCPTLDPATDLVWVGLFLKSVSSTSSPSRMQYLRQGDLSVCFSSPKTGGEYEARLFAHKSLVPVCVSGSTFVVNN